MDRLSHSRSIYATPGRKSYGQRGVLPSEADPFAGLVQATWAFTEWGEHVTLPAFGFLTVKANGSQKAVTSLVFATDLFHPEDQPDLSRTTWRSASGSSANTGFSMRVAPLNTLCFVGTL